LDPGDVEHVVDGRLDVTGHQPVRPVAHTGQTLVGLRMHGSAVRRHQAPSPDDDAAVELPRRRRPRDDALRPVRPADLLQLGRLARGAQSFLEPGVVDARPRIQVLDVGDAGHVDDGPARLDDLSPGGRLFAQRLVQLSVLVVDDSARRRVAPPDDGAVRRSAVDDRADAALRTRIFLDTQLSELGGSAIHPLPAIRYENI
ncbi:unnamed protein product, partial [Nesidiocoris tenuis]